MNPLTAVAIALVLLVLGVAAMAYYAVRPRHFLNIHTSAGPKKRIRVKDPTSKVTWRNPQGEPVSFPLDFNYGRPGKRGWEFDGNDRGQLIRYDNAQEAWIAFDGKRMARALLDGRVQEVARANQESPLVQLAKYALVGLGILGLIVIVGITVLYQKVGA